MTTEAIAATGEQPSAQRRGGWKLVIGVLLGSALMLSQALGAVVLIGGVRDSAVDGLAGVASASGTVAPEPGSTSETVQPESPYEVFGSGEFELYLAAHLMAHEERIELPDVGEAIPGLGETLPGLIDAGLISLTDLEKMLARWVAYADLQNPYVFGASMSGFSDDNGRWVLEVSYNISDAAEYAEAQERLQRAARDALAEIGVDGMSDTDKVVAINDWVIDHTSYDSEYAEEKLVNHTTGFPQEDARGTLLGAGTAICTGYADAFLLLAHEAGLEAVTVPGEVHNPRDDRTGGHAWNRVKLDGTWASLDPTNNDDDDGRQRNMFQFFSEADASSTEGVEFVVDAAWEESRRLHEMGQ